MLEPGDYSSRFAERLRALGATPVLIGALAANRYRVTPRLTTDVDFLVESLARLPGQLEEQGFEVRSLADPGEPPHVAFVRGDGVRVDLVAVQTAYQGEAMERAVDGVLTVEDVLVHKLIAWRVRDRDDVVDILAAGHQLDEVYLDGWVEAWGVADRWQEARRARP